MSQPDLENPIERLKRTSRHLRGTLAEELADGQPGLSTDAQQLIKLHGLYQQKNRDKDALLGTPPKGPVLMVRGRIPGGRLTAEQYLAWDAIADRYGDGTLRITSRQTFELHGVVKGEAKAVLQGLRDALLTTQGACGDVVRNVTTAPNPWGRPGLTLLEGVAAGLSDHFLARSNAYAEIWLDGEKVDPEGETEPLLGSNYLPRKFKIAVTAAGENLVDLYTNDLGFAATFTGSGALEGFFAFAGGGMGMSHGDATTFPRLADLLGWIPADQVTPVAEAVVAVQRDQGNRTNRKQARLKYLIAGRGLPWFQGEVEARWGGRFQQATLPPWRTSPVLGWIPREDGTWALGLHTLSGRLADLPGRPLKAALRALVADLRPSLQLSPDQDLLLVGIQEAAREAVERRLGAAGVEVKAPSALEARAMACVALPLCGLAVTEAERALPRLLDVVRGQLTRHGLGERAPVFRVTGCANGCVRPYAAELALVGRTASAYALYVGGHPEGTRLAFEVAPKVTLEQLPGALDRLFSLWLHTGEAQERLGDFAARVGREALVAELAAVEEAGHDRT
jgi:sulfite reductase beta subunit-like hemoprotein